MTNFRFGILGAGNISETHARAVREIDGADVVAWCGRDSEKAKRLAGNYGGAAFDDLDAFLRSGMDAVIIGTPSGLHAEQAILAARAGVHVLVEKPLDIDVNRVDALLGECERTGVTLGVIFQDRTAPDLVWLHELIATGGLGQPLLVSAHVKWYRPPDYYAQSRWRGTWQLDGGGALMNQGTHTADILLWLLGKVARASGLTRTLLHDIEVEDTALACLEFASGVVGTLEVTTAAYPGFPRRLEITGTHGTIVVEGDRVVSVNLDKPPRTPPPQQTGNASASANSAAVPDFRGHRRVIEDFIDAVRTGRAPLCDGRDGRRSVALVQAVYRSARERSVVDVQ